jgi:hypothetical protein
MKPLWQYFQVAADWIEQPEPLWLKNATQDLQNVMVTLAEAAGKAYLQMLMAKITSVATDTSLSGADKFKAVYTTAIDPVNTVKPLQTLGDSELNTLINGMVSIAKTGNLIP